jgi:hypothetical protein
MRLAKGKKRGFSVHAGAITGILRLTVILTYQMISHFSSHIPAYKDCSEHAGDQ